jgi:SAM-dependent methyltransferase
MKMIPEDARERASFLDAWTAWTKRAERSLRTRGPLGTAAAAAALVRHGARTFLDRVVLDPWNNHWDREFDRRFGVDTAGSVFLPELQSDPRFRHSVHYATLPRSLILRMLRRLALDYNRFVFIDFGCGKGKALLVAAELPFKQIVGIEISSKLISVAEENIRKYVRRTERLNAIQLACMDVCDYPIPREPVVCYFYNPFDAQVMQRVLAKLYASLAAAPREAFVVYSYPPPAAQIVMDESGFLTPIKQTFAYSIYRASMV